MKKKLAALVLALAVGTGALLFAVPAQAYQPLCYKCTYIWFVGFVCDTDTSGGHLNCTNRPTCRVFNGVCLYKVSVNR